MAVLVKHATLTDAPNDASKDVSADAWNEAHAITAGANVLLGTVGAGAVGEIVCTAAGRALLDDADAATQRATLGLSDPTIGTFTAQTGIATATVATSGSASVTGVAGRVWPVAVRGQGSPQLEVNGDGVWSTSGAVMNGDTVKVRLTSSSTGLTERIATLYAQSASSAFSVTSDVGDSDAAAFLSAAGITDETISTAVADLTLALKSASIWTKMKAVYPFVGGTASTHKWNLKDPRDLDAAYRITWAGTVTHDANGITGNGSSGYGDTHFNMSASLAAGSGSFGVYSRTSTQPGAGVNWYDMGSGDGDTSKVSIVICRYNNDASYWCYGMNDGTFTYNTNTIHDGDGLYAANRQNGTNTEGWRNGSKVGEGAKTVSLSTREVYILAFNRAGSAMYHTGRNHAFAYISDGLSDTDMANLYTAVQAFQTSLSRQV